MKSILSFFYFFLLITIVEVGFNSCANIIPPTGGAKDSLPPRLINSTPLDSSKNTYPKKIVLTFDEFVEVKDLQENLIISPLPKINPVIDYKFKNVTIKWKDSLEANTTYAINFGNSIVDLNEGNPFKNFTYVFSTGNSIDSNTLTGKAVVAETGKVDSTLIAVLYKSGNDTAVLKQKPNYIAKILGNGNFTFNNLPKGNFSLYIMPNDYSKKYDDSTKLFAFADSIITVNENTTVATLYAFEQEKRKVNTPSSSSNANREKKLTYTHNLTNGKHDILSRSVELAFNRKLKIFDTSKIILCDTNYKKLLNYTVDIDTSKTKLNITKQWKEDEFLNLIVMKNAIADTSNISLAKTDTIKFSTKKEAEYGTVKIRFNNLDTTKYPVLLIYNDSKLIEAVKIVQRDFYRKLFNPGEYELKILFDKNNDGIYSSGNFFKKIQPEIVLQLNKKLSVRANWDNESEINL